MAGTEPSTEFSTGTPAATTAALRTASSTAGTLSYGTSSPSPANPAARSRAACSVNVPEGPRYAIRGTG